MPVVLEVVVQVEVAVVRAALHTQAVFQLPPEPPTQLPWAEAELPVMATTLAVGTVVMATTPLVLVQLPLLAEVEALADAITLGRVTAAALAVGVAGILAVAPILLVERVRRGKETMAVSENPVQPLLMVLVPVAERGPLVGKVVIPLAVSAAMARPIPFLAPQLRMVAVVAVVATAGIASLSAEQAAGAKALVYETLMVETAQLIVAAAGVVALPK